MLYEIKVLFHTFILQQKVAPANPFGQLALPFFLEAILQQPLFSI